MSMNTVASNETTGPTVEALCEKVESLENGLKATQERLDKAESTIEEQSNTIEEQSQTISELQEQVSENTNEIERGKDSRGHILDDVIDIEDRTEELEHGFEDEKGGCETEESGSTDLYQPESPLEQITNLPEHVANSELTSNQERARFVAKDIRDYGDMRLGEYVISSGDIRKVLAAKEQTTIHWQTVSRVVEYLGSLGGDDVRVKDKHGTIVCFEPEAIERYGSSCKDNGEVTPVVSGQTREV